MTASAPALKKKRRARVRAVLIAVAAAVVAVSAGFLAWASSPMMAEEGPLARAEQTVTVTESAEGVVLAPANPNGEGLVFFAGARVDPAAYADKLSGVAASGITVVIARPTLNFAIFETRPLATWEGLAPGVGSWAVGGHSLGGVRACMYAADETNEVSGIVLFGSYCSVDLSGSGIRALTFIGGNDELSTEAKIEAASDLLPADAEFVTIPDASHAQFGDYGIQPGDGPQDADDADVRDAITDGVVALLG
ncbi:alpha/beta hydrolase [Streptomyces scabiei]|uniref:alpha/beta hydrolase n=1 Tax=Streptomyces scabiei TaxID=1930 RepID=UPI00298F87ED|nr:alpha/beta hydrolase [Streptomyces scabiei]MDW8808311.1 alpha/beta hydrolase [Streptomyces scabiei]